MAYYNIAFCGLGSIGSRHLRNVAAYLAGRGDTMSVDLYRSDVQKPVAEEFIGVVDNVLDYDGEIATGRCYDAVFVTNPTSMHSTTLAKFAGHARGFFVEKPLFDTVEVDFATLKRALGDAIAYVACPLRYNAVLQYVRGNIDCRRALSVRAISSSYLPDWRPGQDYRKCYSAHRSMGGGVGIDLIHEWDYLTWLFGMPDSCKSIVGRVSSLEIDSDDLAIYIARNERTTFEVHLDYFGRSPLRRLEIFMPDDTIVCDIIAGTVDYLKNGEHIVLESERNAYQMREIGHFFDILDGHIANDSTLDHAFEVLGVALS